jgi:hypothetical protein
LPLESAESATLAQITIPLKSHYYNKLLPLRNSHMSGPQMAGSGFQLWVTGAGGAWVGRGDRASHCWVHALLPTKPNQASTAQPYVFSQLWLSEPARLQPSGATALCTRPGRPSDSRRSVSTGTPPTRAPGRQSLGSSLPRWKSRGLTKAWNVLIGWVATLLSCLWGTWWSPTRRNGNKELMSVLARLLSCASVAALEANITPAVGGALPRFQWQTQQPSRQCYAHRGEGKERLKKWKLDPSALPQLTYSNLPCSDVLYVLQCDPSMWMWMNSAHHNLCCGNIVYIVYMFFIIENH